MLEQHRGQQDEVVKIQCVIGLQCAFVAQIGLGAEYVCGTFGARQCLFRQYPVILPVGYALLDDARLIALGAVLLYQQVLDQGLGVLAVENGKAVLQPQ